jgi:AraC-like DNA-binding protein
VSSARPLISTQILVHVVERVAARGVDPAPLLEACSLSRASLHDVEQMVPLAHYVRFMEWAAQRLTDPYFGLHAAQHGDAGTLGAISFLFMSAPTLRDAFSSFIQFLGVIQEGTLLEMQPDQDGVRFVYQITDSRISPRRQDAEYSIAAMYQLIAQYLARQFRPREIYFEHARLGTPQVYADYFGCPVFFGQPTNAVVFDRAVLDARSPRLSTRLYGIITAQLQAAMQERGARVSYTAQVRRLLTEERLSGPVQIGEIAPLLALTPSALARRLAKEEQSFRDILQERRMEVAARLVREGDRAISDIALSVGYAENASFSRAFRRRFGQTAAQVRESSRRAEVQKRYVRLPP